MRNARALILAAVIPLLALAACAPVTPEPESGMTGVVYHQAQAIPDFDDAEYTQDDPAELQKLQDLIDEYGVTIGVSQTEPDMPCDGGRTTFATITYADAPEAFLTIEPCGDGDFQEFNKAADELFSEWKSAAR